MYIFSKLFNEPIKQEQLESSSVNEECSTIKNRLKTNSIQQSRGKFKEQF